MILHRRILFGLICMVLTLSGCDTLEKTWPGNSKETDAEQAEKRPVKAGDNDKDGSVKTAPTRYEVMATLGNISPDTSLENTPVTLPEAIANHAWPQRGASASNAVGMLKLDKTNNHDTATIGDGNEWDSVLVTAPVVAGGTVYAMDAKGYVSAHDANDIDERRWLSDAAIAGDKDILGGGLAVAGDHLFVSTGQGDVLALSTNDGKKIWKRNLGIPVRSAPKIFKGAVYISTIDDQLFALNAASGQISWQHRGLGERVGFMTTISPAINDNLVVVAYGSGEIYGLSADSGQEIWNDSLAQVQKTTATSVFTGFVADPVIMGGMAIAASAGGMTAATHLISGQRIWERNISGGGTPWVAGDFIFQLTNDAQLVALYAADGRVKWVAPLPRFEDKKKQFDPYTWYGPILAGGKLWVFGRHGAAYTFSPETGKALDKQDFSKEIGGPPIISGGVIYYATANGKLHSLRQD